MDVSLNKVKINSHSASHKDLESVVVGTLITEAFKLKLNYKTQQPIRLSDGKLYLLDMYFPDINLAVECDEEQHKNLTNAADDLYRQDQITSISDTDFKRICAHDSADKFFSDLESVVTEMRRRKEELSIQDYDYNTEPALIDYIYNSVSSVFKTCRNKTPYSDYITILEDEYPIEKMWIICYSTTLKIGIQYDPRFDSLIRNNLNKFKAFNYVTDVGYARSPYVLRVTVDNKYFNTNLDKTIEQTVSVIDYIRRVIKENYIK